MSVNIKALITNARIASGYKPQTITSEADMTSGIQKTGISSFSISGTVLPEVMEIKWATTDCVPIFGPDYANLEIPRETVIANLVTILPTLNEGLHQVALVTACSEGLLPEHVKFAFKGKKKATEEDMRLGMERTGHAALNILMGHTTSVIKGTRDYLGAGSVENIINIMTQIRGLSPCALISFAHQFTGELGPGRLRNALPSHKPLRIVRELASTLSGYLHQVANAERSTPQSLLKGIDSKKKDPAYDDERAKKVIERIMTEEGSGFFKLSPF